VQSALLEAMQERQVTIGEQTYKLADPFLVLATQNPLEQEGTYQLPEAQLDRFMLKLKVGYPSKTEERKILDLMGTSAPNLNVMTVVEPDQIIRARALVNTIYVDDRVKIISSTSCSPHVIRRATSSSSKACCATARVHAQPSP
jgi:MoxR-like ATPase